MTGISMMLISIWSTNSTTLDMKFNFYFKQVKAGIKQQKPPLYELVYKKTKANLS